MIEYRRLDSAETEIVGIAFHFRLAEPNSLCIAVRGELVDHGTAGITEREHAGHFVVGFAGGVVTRASDARIGEPRSAVRGIRLDMVENGVAAGHDQADGRHLRMPLREIRL